jgi:hypothetical protein
MTDCGYVSDDDFIVVNKTQKATIDLLKDMVKKNDYIKNCKSNKKKDQSSLSYLIKRDMSQSDCIKLGNGVEKLVTDIILQYSIVKNIKPKNVKDQKERDHLFIDNTKKFIYYAELKANINLDTEKSKATYTKCLDIVKELQKEYPDYTVKWCLLAYRYIHSDCITISIKKKYMSISGNLYGINEYLNMLGIDFQFTEDTYASFLNTIADEMFTDNS